MVQASCRDFLSTMRGPFYVAPYTGGGETGRAPASCLVSIRYDPPTPSFGPIRSFFRNGTPSLSHWGAGTSFM